MSKIAFIGPKSYYRAFSSLGFHCFSADDEKEAKELMDRLMNEDFRLIFTTEDLISSGGLGIIVLPGLKKGKKRTTLKEQMERALGGAVSTTFLESPDN